MDTGFSKTMVIRDLVKEKNYDPKRTVTVHCTHVDVVKYPDATMEIGVQWKVVIVEAAATTVSVVVDRCTRTWGFIK